MEKSNTNVIKSEFLPSFVTNPSQFDGAEETDNGLCLNNLYIPEEIIFHILSYVDPKELLGYSLVCRKWNNMIKSCLLWSTIYKQKYNRKPKQLPWYLYYCFLSTNYFDTNFLLNGNGQDGFKHWEIKSNKGDKCIIEDPPVGADPLPLDQPEFYDKTSCFATSHGTCYKLQHINLGNNKLLRYIMDNYKPHIYLSEWTAGRFDCGCIYKLQCGYLVKDMPKIPYTKPYGINRVEQWQGAKWKKIEINITEYPEGIEEIIFEHEGRDTQFWAGHYGSKMAGGVAKLLFDSIEPLPTDEDGNEIPKRFSQVQFVTNGDQHQSNDQFGIWYEDFDYGELDDIYESELISVSESDENNSEEENLAQPEVLCLDGPPKNQ